MTAGTGGIGGLPPSGAGLCIDANNQPCTLNHATTGWCRQATGEPVIVVTKWDCDVPTASPTVTMIDPSTGAVVPNQVVVPCDAKDWEVNQLCDFDAQGELLATVTQIFEWDEATQALTVRLVRADDPTGPPYVVLGTLGACYSPTFIDVETAMVCGNTAGTLRQLTQMIVYDTRGGLILSVFYLNGAGAVTLLNLGETLTVGDCWTNTLPAILDELEDANVNLDDINTELNSQTLILTDIEANTDQVETILTAIETDTTTIAGAVKLEDSPVVNLDAGIPALARRNDTAVTTTSADGDYTHIATDAAGRVGVSDLGGSLTVDGSVSVSNFPASVEVSNDVGNPLPVTDAALVTTNTQLTLIAGYTDGIEGLITASNGYLLTLSSSIFAEDVPHVSGHLGQFVLAVRNDAAAVLTSANGDYSPIATDSAGRVGIADLGGSITVDGTVAVGPTVTPGTAATNLGKAEDDVHVSGDVGVMALGVRNDNDIVLTSADGDYTAISVDATGRLKTTSIVTATPAVTGGSSLYRNMDVGNVGQVIKGSPGQIYNISARNRANEEIFLKFYNKATAPTAADIPVLVYPIDNNSGSKDLEIASAVGYAFSLGIGIRATNGIADADNTATDLNGMVVNVAFK